MGEPLRKDPPPQTPTPSREEQFNLHRYGNPQRSSGLRWLLLILIVAVIVWFVVWGRGSNTTGHAGHMAAAPVPVPAVKPSLDVPTLLSNSQNYVGQQVHLRDVLVQSTNGTDSIFVGPSESQQVLVILKKGAVPQTLQGKPSAIPQGGIVTVTGTVQKAGSAADLEHSAGISRKQAEQVSKQGIVIEADRADPQTI